MTANPTSFDFGWAPQNATLVCPIWAVNLTGDSISLTEIKTGCGCLVVRQQPDGIPSGDSLGLSCYWQTRSYSGPRSISAYLYTSDDRRPVEVKIGGKIVTDDDSTASIGWRPRRLAFGQVSGKRKSRTEQVITLTNRTQTDLAMTVVEQGPELNLQMAETIPAEETANIRVAIAPDYSEADFETSFTLEFSGNAGEKFRVSIPVVHGDFSFRPVFTTTKQ
jgi:hypothetical protein